MRGMPLDTLTHQLALLGVNEGTKFDQRVDNAHLLLLDRLVHGAGACVDRDGSDEGCLGVWDRAFLCMDNVVMATCMMRQCKHLAPYLFGLLMEAPAGEVVR